MTLAAKGAGFGRTIAPAANLDEAALVDGIDVYAVAALADAVAVRLGQGARFRRRGATVIDPNDRNACGDFADERGQIVANLNRSAVHLLRATLAAKSIQSASEAAFAEHGN